MKVRGTLDKAGRIMIPKRMLAELQLAPGDPLELENTGEKIMLRPIRVSPQLTQEHGVWVLHTGQPLPASLTDTVWHQIQQERESDTLITTSLIRPKPFGRTNSPRFRRAADVSLLGATPRDRAVAALSITKLTTKISAPSINVWHRCFSAAERLISGRAT